MQSNIARHLDTYRADWQRYAQYQSGSDVDPTRDLRENAWEEFARIGFPIHRRGNEHWKYTDLRPIDRIAFRLSAEDVDHSVEQFAPHLPFNDDCDYAVFVNGFLAQDKSGGRIQQIQACSWVGELARFAGDAFVSLNTAFMNVLGGAYVEFLPGCRYDKPLHIVHVSTVSEDVPLAIYPRIAIEMGEGSSGTLIESHISISDATHLSVPVVEIRMGSNSSLTHLRYQDENEKSFHFATTRVSQDEGSNYKSTSFCVGASIGRNDVFTSLEGEYADSTLHGVYVTTNQQHQDNEISTTHAAPHCTSDQYFKGILSGRSRAVFSGKIVVERGAQKTDANQKDLNLLLSHGAEVDTKPSLEIYADDVKCAHGATAGHVDEDTLFYLQSRGVDYDTAQAMLIRGFAAEILGEVEDVGLREFLEDRLDALMPALQAASDTIGTA